jgi:hypothetical protein
MAWKRLELANGDAAQIATLRRRSKQWQKTKAPHGTACGAQVILQAIAGPDYRGA